jgi:hypothetical protein
VIVRIFTDGQYRVPEEAEERLHELDNAASAAADADDEDAFSAALAALVDHIHQTGERLADDDLEPSDAMLPPPDTTLAEARKEFTAEGLIPDPGGGSGASAAT